MSEVQQADPPKSNRGRYQQINRFHTFETVKAQFVAHPEAGTAYEEVLRPEYWAHIANKVPILSEIVVHPEENHYYARLLVTFVGRATLVVKQIEYVSFGEEDPNLVTLSEDDLDISYKGPVSKWRISRKSDGQTVSEGHASKVIAEQEALQYRKALAA